MSQSPNLLFFLTDDHGAWATGCHGNPTVQTPTLDGLAARGARFSRAYTPSPVCSPARAALLTGRTPSQVGIHDWLEEDEPAIAQRDWLHGQETLFHLLHGAGYATALCGKWHLGRSHLPPAGADYHFGLPGWQGRHNESYTYTHNGHEVTLDGNKSARITDHALDFLAHAPADRPFFLNVGYIATHSPYGRQHHDPALTALYDQADFAEIPVYNSHPWVKNEDGPGESPPPNLLRDRYVGYYAAVAEIDRNVGRILALLAEQGRLENTLVVYTSDHGCALGHHGFWGKGNSTRPLNMYDTSLHVPLIWSGPGVPAGGTVTQCVDHYDTFMTLVDLLGLALPAQAYPGSSYGRLWHGETAGWDETIIGEYGDLRMVRTPEWKFVRRYPDGPNDLFDLRRDPGETRNLAQDPACRALIRRLDGEIRSFYREHEEAAWSGLRVKELPRHNRAAEAWRDGRREARGLQKA